MLNIKSEYFLALQTNYLADKGLYGGTLGLEHLLYFYMKMWSRFFF